jgi:hypothetical protein
MFVTVAEVRAYLDIEGVSGKHGDPVIQSNIRAAGAFLERATGRQFEFQDNVTKTFTTNGAATVAIADLRSASAVTMEGSALTADETYWLIADSRQTGIYTTVQLRPYGSGGGRGYLAHPQWFDRNLDRYGGYGSLPNDLTITGDWGYTEYPPDFLHTVKVLAAWYTKRPASVLANVAFTPDGSALNYADLPPEVNEFVKAWRLGSTMALV